MCSASLGAIRRSPRGGTFAAPAIRASSDQINHEEMLAAMAPVPELLRELEALEPVMDRVLRQPAG